MDLKVKCERCNGEGKVWTKVKSDLETLNTCKVCDELGELAISKQELKYKIAYLNRQVNYLWDIVKHKTKIPYEYFFELSHTCKRCKGSGGEWVEAYDTRTFRRCSVCNGLGSIKPSTKEIYKYIFAEFVELKEMRDECVKALETYDKEDFKDYKLNPFDKIKWLCVKCEHFNNPTSCNGCFIETNGGSPMLLFSPHSEQSGKWFKEIGSKIVSDTLGYKE